MIVKSTVGKLLGVPTRLFGGYLLTTKPDNPSSIPATYMVEGKN